ncbi:hypothetical protein QBC45DRAFT_457874 [Copromyces sp. CBS 386.78]|nr:hypothetical protein QBC45DRAFT_457874 [Copromyces sp. CBS 386.78]
MAATSFPLFMYLPFELRARVWELTAEPRTITLSEGRRDRALRHCPVPALVHVCREARQLGVYRKMFSELYDCYPPWPRRYIWLNMELDMVDISECHSLTWFAPIAASFPRLQFQRDYITSEEVIFLGRCVNLKELHIVPHKTKMLNWHVIFTRYPLACGLGNIFTVDPLLGLTPVKPEYTLGIDGLRTKGEILPGIQIILSSWRIQWGQWKC